MFKLKQKGMSLVEVTVAGAVAVGLSLGIMQLNQTSVKSSGYLASSHELQQFKNFLHMNLAKGGNCSETLNGAGYTVAGGAMGLASLDIQLATIFNPATGLFELPPTPEVLTLVADETTQISPEFPSWKIDTIDILPLTNSTVDMQGNQIGRCELRILALRKKFDEDDGKRSFGARKISFSIPLSCNVDPVDSTKINYCVSDTTVRMGFWVQHDPLDINSGIRYDRDVVIGQSLIVRQHVVVESDERIKEKILPLENSLEKISKINSYTYNLKNNSSPQIGLLAQEVEKIYPEAVESKKDGTKGVRYSMLIPVLVDALKEQQKIIQEQNKKIDKIEKELINQNLRKAD